MSDDGHGYFQFPICLLARKGNFSEVLSTVIHYSFGGMVEDVSGETWDDLRDHGELEDVFAKVSKKLRVYGFTPEGSESTYKTGESWVLQCSEKFGHDALVRIRTDLVFDARDGTGLPERDFRVLAAIYSAIGNKPFAHVSTSRITHRAAGCKSKDVFDRWDERGPIYTPKQIRGAVDRLKGFFARATFNRSETYYSHRMDGNELREAIVSLKIGEPVSGPSEDDQMNAKIAQLKAEKSRKVAATSGQGEGNPKATSGQGDGQPVGQGEGQQ